MVTGRPSFPGMKTWKPGGIEAGSRHHSTNITWRPSRATGLCILDTFHRELDRTVSLWYLAVDFPAKERGCVWFPWALVAETDLWCPASASMHAGSWLLRARLHGSGSCWPHFEGSGQLLSSCHHLDPLQDRSEVLLILHLQNWPCRCRRHRWPLLCFGCGSHWGNAAYP